MLSSARRMLGTITAGCALGAVAMLLPFASTAQASLIDLGLCNSNALSQPFAPWGDSSSYELVPGGDFESSAWTLNRGAQLVAGSEPYAATGTLGRSSLSLPSGSSAQSPSTCVDAAYPSVRFFVGGTGVVAVSMVDGGVTIPVGVVVAGGTWTPTPVMIAGSPLVAALSGGIAQISYQFTGVLGSPLLDDVFVDPWSRG